MFIHKYDVDHECPTLAAIQAANIDFPRIASALPGVKEAFRGERCGPAAWAVYEYEHARIGPYASPTCCTVV